MSSVKMTMPPMAPVPVSQGRTSQRSHWTEPSARSKAVFVVLDCFAAESAAMNGDPARGDIRKDFVVGVGRECRGLAGRNSSHPAAADGDVAHVAIEHGESGGGMPDEELEQFLALAEVGFDAFSFGDVLDGAAHEEGMTSSHRLRSGRGHEPNADCDRWAERCDIPDQSSTVRVASIPQNKTAHSVAVFGVDKRQSSLRLCGRSRVRCRRSHRGHRRRTRCRVFRSRT